MNTLKMFDPARRLFGVVFRPEHQFSDIKANPRWLGTYLYLCAGKVIVEIFHSLIELRVLRTDLFNTLEPDKLEKTFRLIKATSYITIILVPAVVILKNLITAGLLYWLIVLVKDKVEFRKILSAVIHCWLIVLISRYFNLLILYIKGYENLVYLDDLKVNAGLDILLKGNENVILKTIFENITVFSLWYLVLLVVAISIVSEVSKKSAGIAVIFVWLLNIAWKIGQSMWNENMGKYLG